MDTHNGLSGFIRSAELAQPVDNVEIVWTDEEGISLLKATSDENGQWSIFELPESGHVTFQKNGYVSKEYKTFQLPKTVRLLENRLIGYQDRLWFEPGEYVETYVHAPEHFSAKLCRHGYKKEVLEAFNAISPIKQQIPDINFTASGLNWEVALQYRIPEEANPGLYSLLLESKNQQSFAIPFIVSSAKQQVNHPELLVLASTNNWQAYNIWGGRSRYRNFEDGISKPYLRDPNKITEIAANLGKMLPRRLVKSAKNMLGMEQSDPEWKFKRLSIRRPLTNCQLESGSPIEPFTNHLAAGEWRILAWLERENYDYDIVSGFQLHENPGILNHYKAILLSTHSEYWSEKMYAAIKKFHNENGLSIINLSGNSIYREVDFFEDGSLHCKSLKFEESIEDETQLIGVRFTEGDLGTCAPYRITEPDHWVFKNMPDIYKNKIFGKQSLNRFTPPGNEKYNPGRPGTESGLKGEGASGWETDKLSASAPSDFRRVAKGENRWGGADMVVRDTEGTRGGVFSASSITYGGALLIDKICSGITKRVLNRFLEKKN